MKIADFGLATSGEWIYQEAYRSSRRKELLRKYHKSIIDDGREQTLEVSEQAVQANDPAFSRERWKRMHADSVVGTYYYMAPEVIQGENYNATADWYLTQHSFLTGRWSLGIIFFECLFGYPPFWATTRKATQKSIIDWKNNLEIPLEPRTSDPAKHLLRSLLTSADNRLRTPTWEIDISIQQGYTISRDQRLQVNAKDIRHHWFFRTANFDFESVHLMKPPCLPKGDERSPRVTRPNSDIKPDRTEKPMRTKDIMLRDEQVLKERRFGAFKNYTYRGVDLDGILDRFGQEIESTEK